MGEVAIGVLGLVIVVVGIGIVDALHMIRDELRKGKEGHE